MASCTTPTRRTPAGSTRSGGCTRGSTAPRRDATRRVRGSGATTSTRRRRRSGDSEIQNYVAARSCAADQRASVGSRFDRIRAVVHAPRDQRCLACMADAGPARPAHRHVAGLGEFEQRGVVLAPRNAEIAARELDRRAAAGRTGGCVRRARRYRRDAGRLTGRGAERLRVNTGGLEAQGCQSRAYLLHERRWATYVCVGGARRVEIGEHGGRQMARGVEVLGLAVVSGWAAVADVGTRVGKRSEKRASLGGER